MTTPTHRAEELQNLITESHEFELLARPLHDDAAPRDEREAIRSQLQRDYSAWYVRALAALPDDLRDDFRKEYEGSTFALKIKKYLFEALTESPLFDPTNPIFPKYSYQLAPTFLQPLEAQRHLLAAALQQLSVASPVVGEIENLARILMRFNHFLGALRTAIPDNELIITNESDLQRLLTPALRLIYPDVRPEDFVPNFGGARSRTDFFLPEPGIALETKITRPTLPAGRLRDELIIDFRQYASLERVLGIVAFVYDPDRRLANPAALDDLSNLSMEKPLHVVTLAGR